MQGNRLTFTLPTQNNQPNPPTYQAETQSPVKAGQAYTVKVIATQPKLQLQLQTAPAPQTTQVQYRQLLPNMQPLAQALEQLSQPSLLKQLPPQLQQNIQKLLENLLKPSKIKAEDLKQQFKQSGLFFENKLGKAILSKSPVLPSSQTDLKGQLLKLQSALAQQAETNAQIQKAKNLVDKMLNRITLNQLQTLESPYLITDLPIAPNPYFQQITLKASPPEQAKAPWTLFLELHTAQGQWLNTLTFREPDELHLQIWIEEPPLRATVEAQLPTLAEQLQTAGIQLKTLHLQTQPPEPPKTDIPPLIDIKI